MTVSGIGAAGSVGVYSLTPTLNTKVAPTIDSSNLALPSAAVLPVAPAPQSAFTLTAVTPATQNVIYSRPAVLNSDKLAWSTPPTDDISRVLETGLKAHSGSASLLSGLGAQLLDRVATTQGDFRQAVVSYRDPAADSAQGINAAAGASALQNAQHIQNKISLQVYTVSGKEVDVSITFGGDGNSIQDSLSFDVHSSSALSADEQTAIGKLSKGFEAALQGITSGTTKVDVSGLVNYDATVLSGVDLKVGESPQTSALQSLDFHADASRRSFSMQGQAGTVAVSVDLSAPALRGSEAQQQSAVLSYLDQFDAANQRAHGGATLLAQFKDAFAQMNSSYPAPGQQPAPALSASVLNDKDRSVLTGLADFQASMSGDFSNGSATHVTTEAGHIDYEVSQTTKTQGFAKRTGLSVVQTQTSDLDASVAASRNGAMLDIASGNYDIDTFKDSASTSTSFEYADDKLQSAARLNRVNQSEIDESLVNHKIVDQKSTPHSTFTMQDISAQLRPTP
jgi:hypothetical protein